jgi:hypothetical protein
MNRAQLEKLIRDSGGWVVRPTVDGIKFKIRSDSALPIKLRQAGLDVSHAGRDWHADTTGNMAQIDSWIVVVDE